MQFILTAGWEDGVADLTERLVRELASGKKVLWLVSGGSNIPASSQIMDNIPSRLSQNLTVTLVDERYGDVGHEESNWAQLMTSGFNSGQATLLPVLQDDMSFEQTIDYYDQIAGAALADNTIVIAQLGIGPDGHIAGILPDSSSSRDTDDIAVGYKSTPFDRLTLTYKGLRMIDVAYTFAFGNTKHQALDSLQSKSLGLAKQPSEILKEIPEAYIYNDQCGEHK
ncbi:MAG: 6-phosphogluconolactonase [Patescibacteria group bacterium]